MKLIMLLLLLCTACQKDVMPKAKDLYDRDGDGVQNEFDLNPEIVDIPDFEKIAGRIFFFDNKGNYHHFKFQNSEDLENYYSSNLIKRNLLNDFFTEYTVVDILKDKTHPLKSDLHELTKIEMEFEASLINPENVYLTYKDREVYLVKWSQRIEINLSTSLLLDLLENRAKITFEYSELDKMRIQTIKEASKRVIYATNNSIEVFYIAKSTPVSGILHILGLPHANDLRQVNLYQTQTRDDQRTWVKEENDTVFIIEDSLKNIYESFLTNFERHDVEILRVNGHLQKTLNIVKDPRAAVILKFSGSKTHQEFSEHRKDIRIGGGGKEGSHDLCKNWYRQVSKTTEVPVQLNEIVRMLKLQQGILFSNNHELTFTDGHNKLNVTNENLDPLKFVIIGRYGSECKEISKSQAANEGFLKVKVEAYIEKI